MKNKFTSNHLQTILAAADKPEMISFAGGLPHPSTFPVNEIKEAFSTVLTNIPEKVLQYTKAQGCEKLRESISERYKKIHLNIDPADIIITSGGQQAIYLLVQLLLEKSNKILVEDPIYLGASLIFKQSKLGMFGVSINNQGIDLKKLNNQIKKTQAKTLYGVSSFNNPSGISYSNSNRMKLAEILYRDKLFFIEDDPYYELAFSTKHSPPVKKYAPDRTFLLGSFSKTLSPGLRVGWICSPKEFTLQLTNIKQSLDLFTSNLTQHALTHLFENFDYDKHILSIKNLYQKKSNILSKSIQKYFGQDMIFQKSKGGLFLWVRSKQPINTEILLQEAFQQNVLFVPGNAFAVDHNYDSYMRMNYSNIDKDKVDLGVKILSKIYYQKK